MKTQKINLVKNDIEIIIEVKSNIELDSKMKDNIYKALCRAFWYEDDIKGLIALDTPISKDSTYWLSDIKNSVLYGENDKILSMDISCTLFDDKALPDMEAIKKAKYIVNAILN